MFWTKLLKRLSEDVNEHLLLQNELLKAQVLELQTHHNGRVRYSAFFKRRMARLAKLLTPEGLSDSCLVVKPSTVLRWHRELIAKKFDGSAMRTYPGRPRIDVALEAHILDMADNNRWGAMRIKGALAHIGHSVSHQTILNVLKRHGLHPAPRREHDDSWARFLRIHLSAIVATDFLTAEVLTPKGYVTYFILFFIRLETRRVTVAGITQHPNEAWMLQIARNLTGVDDEFLKGTRYLICDRDTKYTRQFRRVFRGYGVKVIRLPPYSPNLNAHAERWVRSIKEDCLNHIVPLGEGFLRAAVKDYVEFYNQERPHQGLNNRFLTSGDEQYDFEAPLKVKERLGGLLNYYFR
jgi:putative transposase